MGSYCVGLQRFVASPHPSPSLRFWRGGLNGLLTFLLDYLVFRYRSVPFSQFKERAFGVAIGVKGRAGFWLFYDLNFVASFINPASFERSFSSHS